MEKELHLRNRLADLVEAEAALEALGGEDGPDVETLVEVRLVIEEVFTNIVKHAHRDGRDDHPVTLRFTLQPGLIELEFIDAGVAFNPLTAAADETSRPFAERNQGLMGLPLIRGLMPECHYERRAGRNRLRLRRRFGPPM